MDGPTEGPPTTILKRTGAAGEAGTGGNKGGMAEEVQKAAGHETAEEETAERCRVPAAAYDGVLTVLCDAKQRDAALDLFEHMLHEVRYIVYICIVIKYKYRYS